jgi:hypothetical protein
MSRYTCRYTGRYTFSIWGKSFSISSCTTWQKPVGGLGLAFKELYAVVEIVEVLCVILVGAVPLPRHTTEQ